MSLDVTGQKCVVCSAYLFPDDDVVFCPQCGAPHHRECYKSVGHCGLEDKHGTENQYKKIEIKADGKVEEKPFPDSQPACRGCRKVLEKDAKFCPYCGLPTDSIPPFSDISPYGKVVEIKDDEPIDEGVTALDAAKTVVLNPLRYIPKFLNLRDKNKKSWNWAAFLLPHAWFAYRKMYLPAVVSGIFILISQLFSLPLSAAIAQLPTPEQQMTYMEYAYYLAENATELGFLPLLLSFIGLSVGIVVRIICGIYGDWIYKNSVVSAVRKIREAEEGADVSKKLSGVSFFAFTIAFFGVTVVYDIIAMFLI